MMRRTVGIRMLSWVILCLIFGTPYAWAGNDDEVLIGTDAVLTGGAVTASVEDGSALWYNPAGLGRSGRHQVDVSGTAYTYRVWNIPEYLEAPNGTVANGNTSEAVTIPSAITYVRTINDRWSAGFGYFLSRWSDVRGHTSIAFPDAGSTALWQTGYVGTYSLHNAVLGVSCQVNDTLRFGAGLIGIYNGITSAYQFSGGVGDDPNSGFITGSDLSTENHSGLQLQVGVQWQASRSIRLGASIRSPAVSFLSNYSQDGYESAGFDLNQVPNLGPGLDPSRPLFYGVQNDEKSVWGADWLLPPRFRLGINQKLNKAWWSFDFDLQTGIASRKVLLGAAEFQAVDRSPVLNARLGGKYSLSETMAVGLGIFTDRGSTNKEAVGLGRFHFYGVATGIEVGNVHKLDSVEPSDRLRFSTSLGLRYAIGFGEVGTLEIPEFYEMIGEMISDPEYELKQISTHATAHEITLNLGAGIYF